VELDCDPGIEHRRSSPRDALADALMADLPAIKARCLGELGVMETANGDGATRTDLEGAIENHLAYLTSPLLDGHPQSASGGLRSVDGPGDLDVGGVVRELLILRRVLLDVAQERGLVTGPDEAGRLVRLMDAGTAALVKSHVEMHQQEARWLQARYIGFITHELRNPLTVATVAATQLRRLVTSLAAGRALDLLDRSLHRIRDLTDRILLTERFEAGEVQTHPEDVSLGTIIDQALLSARENARAKGIDVLVECDGALLLRVDLELAAAAVQNVVDNAVKFTDSGRVEITVKEQGASVVVHVRDTCRGIPAEDLLRVFQPFQRGRTGKLGTGLGLAIAKRAVESHGGSIHAESSEGHGCHFWFDLPKAESAYGAL